MIRRKKPLKLKHQKNGLACFFLVILVLTPSAASELLPLHWVVSFLSVFPDLGPASCLPSLLPPDCRELQVYQFWITLSALCLTGFSRMGHSNLKRSEARCVNGQQIHADLRGTCKSTITYLSQPWYMSILKENLKVFSPFWSKM